MCPREFVERHRLERIIGYFDKAGRLNDYLVVQDPAKAAEMAFSAVHTRRRLTWRGLVDDTGRLTGKRVIRQCLPRLRGKGATGLWFDLPDENLVLHPPLSLYHGRYVLAHECAHMVFVKLGFAPPSPWLYRRDPRDLPTDVLLEMASAHRRNLSSPGETAAELFAILATERERADRLTFRRGIA